MSTEHYRPRYHFTPERNWMNDPNGLVYDSGTYHLFFQHNPHGQDWGNMSWGHATSADLLSWNEQPVALVNTPDEQIFSGSIGIDHGNTSGFSDGSTPPWVAVYTSAYTSGKQAQSLSVSTDSGATWHQPAGNPVLDRDSTDFRDPKVMRLPDRHGRERWIMLAVEAVQRQVLIYSSDDLRTWVLESLVGPLGPSGVVWECPDLFPLNVDGDPEHLKWVLLISTNPPDLSASSKTAYVIGDFDGHVFRPDEPRCWNVLDYGHDFYAAASFANMPGQPPILLGWAGNWQYAAQTPTRPWRGAMSLPRQVSLQMRDGEPRLVQEVPAETLSLLSKAELWQYGPAQLLEPVSFPVGRHYWLDIEWEIAGADEVGIDLLVGQDSQVRLSYHPEQSDLTIDRTHSGLVDFHPSFPSLASALVPARDGRLALQIFVDGSVLEVFADRGATTFTDQVFPDTTDLRAILFGRGGSPIVTMRHHSLEGLSSGV